MNRRAVIAVCMVQMVICRCLGIYDHCLGILLTMAIYLTPADTH